MKRNILLASAAAIVLALTACGPNHDKEVSQIKALEDSIYSSNKLVLDTTMGNNLVALYTQFANDFPDDPATPGYLFNAADISSNMCHYNESIELLNRIINNYDTVSNLGDCYFSLAQAYEGNNDYENANETYKLFVELFPEHPIASDTKIMLDNNLIGLSPEEMLNRILNQTDSTNI
ncbi:MAG: tetratricopeptide repeat protein [Bacteroidales bacterium]|nr:tetratricopeptide repeat protein [Bacteroidales bacterium]